MGRFIFYLIGIDFIRQFVFMIHTKLMGHDWANVQTTTESKGSGKILFYYYIKYIFIKLNYQLLMINGSYDVLPM